MNILFVGDIVGKKALEYAILKINELKHKKNIDFIIVNGENINNGKGLIKEEANLLFEAGINIITTGNHIWDNWKSRPLLAENADILRPLNYPSGNVGAGFAIKTLNGDESIGVLQLQGRTYMQPIDCPFKAADFAIKKISEKTNIIIVDFHADATAEKIALGWYLDGRVSALIGTHTHIPTSDATILPNGTAYITDVGMTGPYDSVVGMRKEIALKRFLLQTAHKFEVAEEDIRFCAVFIKINTKTAQAMEIEHIILPEFERKINI